MESIEARKQISILCRGCGKLFIETSKCWFQTYNQIHLCPCLQCLIKTSCSQECKDRIDIKSKRHTDLFKEWVERKRLENKSYRKFKKYIGNLNERTI